MEEFMQIVLTVICSVLASSGFWAYFSKKIDKNSAEKEMLRGLAHDRIIYLGMAYIERGWVTQDEFENLHDYLYTPYEKLGGNGSAKKVMNDVEKLPIHSPGWRPGN